jgi:hypothetical protein
VQTITDQLPPDFDPLRLFREGLQISAQWSRLLNADGLLARNLPVLGDSLGQSLNGQPVPTMPAGDAQSTASASVFRALRQEGSQVLRRLLEGEDGFNLSEIGDSIASLDALR